MNPFLSPSSSLKTPTVKFQVITREGQEIVVGRVKIPTPGNGHAFILRRFDTGAISQTTMFRASFPTSSEEIEKGESSWVKSTFDCSAVNGNSGKNLRLAGTWVHPETASKLAPEYYLENVIQTLMTANPDPKQEYRRSTKPNQANDTNSSPAKAPRPVSSNMNAPPSPGASPKPKRRKEEKEATPEAPSSGINVPTSRRVARGSSPAPITTPRSVRKLAKPRGISVKLESPKKAVVSLPTPIEKVQEEDEDAAEIPGPDMQQDIAEQKALIERLKAEKAEREAAKKEKEEEVSETSELQITKRAREEEDSTLQFKFREPEEEEAIANREIKSNRRLSLDLEPQQKSAAWGALWFISGLAAAVTIPSFFI